MLLSYRQSYRQTRSTGRLSLGVTLPQTAISGSNSTRQARNTDAERKAADVRLRAELRTGELLKELARAEVPNPNGIGGKGGKVVASNGATQQSPYAAALESAGLSRQTAHRYQALAEIPRDIFEAHLADPVCKPTTTQSERSRWQRGIWS